MDLTFGAVLILISMCCLGVYGQSISQFEYEGKECTGTDDGRAVRADAEFRYNEYKTRYTNCTYVQGNLELIMLDSISMEFNMDFVKDIREVTGYVLIISVYANVIPLRNLRIIRGKTLYNYRGEQYSLYVSINSQPNSRTRGLKELQLVSLHEIMRGKIFFHNNNLLCFENSILWHLINPHVPVKDLLSLVHDNEYHRRRCGACHPACTNNATGQRHCWGSGPDMCQRITNVDLCGIECCVNDDENECCDKECAGGCLGPKATDCWACRHFLNENVCVAKCPEHVIYDSHLYQNVRNPKGKYAYGSLCKKECPSHLMIDDDACVKRCPKGKYDKNNTCTPCINACPKECFGGLIDFSNVETFRNCTKVNGNVKILLNTFKGDPFHNVPEMHPRDLQALENVEEITGYLMIQSDNHEFKNLSFLSNLRKIVGRNLDHLHSSFDVLDTQLESLELTNLVEIGNGKVLISNNYKLCYAHTINFSRLYRRQDQQTVVGSNRDPLECENHGLVCDAECSDDGCWGKGSGKCLSCRNFNVDRLDICVKSCNALEKTSIKNKIYMFNAGNRTCKKCHYECDGNCTGPTSNDCHMCKNVCDGPTNCMTECPAKKYPDENNNCQFCHENCGDGCSGNSTEVNVWGGCINCEIGLLKTIDESPRIFCLHPNSECPESHYLSIFRPEHTSPMAGKKVCCPCHEECLTCRGPGAALCSVCRNYRFFQTCVPACQSNMYADHFNNCRNCHSECLRGCTGPSSWSCTACKNLKVYLLPNNTNEFNCTQECPEDSPYHLGVKKQGRIQEQLCVDATHPEVMRQMERNREQEKKQLATIIGPSVAGVVLVVLFGALAVFFCQRRERARENALKLTARMSGYDESEPLTPTEARPDLAQLRLIKESDLRKGNIIGSGAFGTVYKGLWIPDGENIKIPVAIKVLQEGTSPSQNKELLEEARVMASVDHTYCIRILAVCMTAQMMLITQLMPLGNLLDYVTKNRDYIGSKALLNWCTQIAKGMTYLEERGIVHRDLAARNVLVQSPKMVRITDFGLAKLLDFNEEAYRAASGKMPIKWLALECIQHRIFTHKSDVWSFGVTAWELFTKGKKPYENIRARDVPDLLEKGERLPQPTICTIDVYMIMIKCWMLDADSRPSFRELADEFSKMARDPGRYLVIKGDELMRLPSHTYDKEDLIRNMSVAEDIPGEVVEAEDYLQPQSRSSSTPGNSPTKSSMTHPLLTPDEPETSTSTADPKQFSKGKDGGATGHSHPRREKRYGHLESAAARRRQSPTKGHGDSDNTRYSSDPMNLLMPDMDKSPDDDEKGHGLLNGYPDMPPSPPPPLPVDGPPRRLPVDEDDYLQPKSTNPAAYMDLVDSKEYYNEINEVPPTKPKPVPLGGENYMSMGKPVCTIDNPEYFDQLDDPFDSEPNGVFQPVYIDAHKYYNDCDVKYPAERTPLNRRPTESTV